MGKIHNIIDQAKLNNRVHVIGYVPDGKMIGYYQNCQLFVLPSLFEPFGMTTQEAMACGKPVICSKFGGIRTVIKNNINGILVDPSDPKLFAEAMEKVLTDDSFRSNLGKQAHYTVINEFSWEAIAKRFLDFYENYLD